MGFRAPVGADRQVPPAARRLIPVVLLFSLTACPGDWKCKVPGMCNDDDRGLLLPQVVSIEIIPHVIYADLRDGFRIDAQALDANGRVISGADLQYTWIPGREGVYVSGHGSSATVVIAAPPAERTVIEDAVKVTAGAHSATVTVIASHAGLPAPFHDRVEIHHPSPFVPQTDIITYGMGDRTWAAEDLAGPAPRPSGVILDALVDGECRRNWTFAVSEGGFLGDNVTGECSVPGSQVAIIPEAAGGHGEGGTFLSRNALGSFSPTYVTGDIWNADSHGTFSVTLEAPVDVEVAVWPLTQDISQGSLAKISDDLKLAQRIFDEGRVGIRLYPITMQTPVSPRPIEFPVKGSRCVLKSNIVNAIGEESFLADRRKLHVVYVENTVTPTRGGICLWQKDRDFALAIIDTHKRAPTTLAHEIGHLLGLNDDTMIDSGHALKATGFDPANLMWPAEDPDSPANRERITLGQAFRMNFDRRSWLHMVDSTRVSKCCQADPLSGDPCPDAWIDLKPALDPGELGWSPRKRSCNWWGS